MKSNKKMHFEISERKLLLRFCDIAFVLSALFLLHFLFDVPYFNLERTYYFRPLMLIVYLTVFGSIFEMYNLQVASNQLQILPSSV